MAVVAKPDGYVDMTAAALHPRALRIAGAPFWKIQVWTRSFSSTPGRRLFFLRLEVAKGLAAFVKEFNKPVFGCLMKGEPMAEARRYLEENGVPPSILRTVPPWH